ncbi:MAG: apolipoprotein N-acyltransferase [Armatimonadetes bacterium]|nr:apolipoprotein N-acyltransferase [Armatimonadota bacterium]
MLFLAWRKRTLLFRILVERNRAASAAPMDWTRRLLAVLSGLLLHLAFPPANWYVLGLCFAIPLFFALKGTQRREAFKLGWLFGFSLLVWEVRWANSFGWPSWLLLASAGALYYGLCAFLLRLGPDENAKLWPVYAAVLWTLLEILRSAGVLGFPWALVGTTSWRIPCLIQSARVIGVFGLSFLLLLVNGFLYTGMVRREPKSLVMAVLVLLVPTAAGLWDLQFQAPSQGRRVRVAIVQSSIPQDEKWQDDFKERNIETLERLLKVAARGKPDLIFFPETAIAGYLPTEEPVGTRVRGWAARYSIPLVFGALGYDPKGDTNIAVVCTPQGKFLPPYVKVQLVPMGEYIPPWIRNSCLFVRQKTRWGTVVGRKEQVTLDSGPAKLGVLICFESLFPRLSQNLCRQDVELLAILSNTAWAVGTNLHQHHMAASLFRSLETGLPLLQAANTGASFVADQKGRILALAPPEEEKVLFCEIPLVRGKAPYSMIHPYLFWALLMVFLMLLYGSRELRKAK